MKVWIINQYNMPPEFGHHNRHFNFGKYLKEMGYEPTVFVGSYLHNVGTQMIKDKSLAKKYEGASFSYYFVRTIEYAGSKIKRVYAMLQFYRNVMKLSKKIDKPDVILGSSGHPLSALAAIRLAKKYKCQSIVEIRDLWPESFVAYNLIKPKSLIAKILYRGEKWLYEKADKIIFTMEGGKDYIINQGWDIANGGKIDLNKIYHINNGTDLEQFDFNRNYNQLKDPDLENENSFKVIYTGSIRLVNDVKKIVDVAEEVQKNGNDNIQFLIYGPGEDREYLEKYSKKNNIKNIKFKGYIDKKYIPYVLSRADLNLMHANYTSITKYGASLNKMFDYFASGNPTLSDCEYGYDLVNRYEAGISVTTSSITDIANLIIQFEHLPDEAQKKYSENARKAAEDYSFEVLTRKLVNVLKD